MKYYPTMMPPSKTTPCPACAARTPDACLCGAQPLTDDETLLRNDAAEALEKRRFVENLIRIMAGQSIIRIASIIAEASHAWVGRFHCNMPQFVPCTSCWNMKCALDDVSEFHAACRSKGRYHDEVGHGA